jgi:hypothetical protein
MQARITHGMPAAKVTAVGAELIDTDLPVDCAEFDVGVAWEALRAAEEIYGSIASGTVCSGHMLLEPSAN